MVYVLVEGSSSFGIVSNKKIFCALKHFARLSLCTQGGQGVVPEKSLAIVFLLFS